MLYLDMRYFYMLYLLRGYGTGTGCSVEALWPVGKYVFHVAPHRL
jgi:hypothetical protein